MKLMESLWLLLASDPGKYRCCYSVFWWLSVVARWETVAALVSSFPRHLSSLSFPGQSESLPLLKTMIRQKRSLSAWTALLFLLLEVRTWRLHGPILWAEWFLTAISSFCNMQPYIVWMAYFDKSELNSLLIKPIFFGPKSIKTSLGLSDLKMDD